jgi:hypothetical protein
MYIVLSAEHMSVPVCESVMNSVRNDIMKRFPVAAVNSGVINRGLIWVRSRSF